MSTVRKILGLSIVAMSLIFSVGCSDGDGGGGAPAGGAGGGGAAAPGAGG